MPQPHLIETMRLEPDGTVPLLEGHLARLRHSCSALGYSTPDAAGIQSLVARRAAELGTGQSWRLRLLTAPDGTFTLEHGPLATPPGPLPVVVEGPRQQGATFWLQHKSTYRPWYEKAEAWLASQSDVFDVLYWNEHGEMCEGSRSNLYMLAPDGRWLTPPLTSGALPGVQRAALLQAGLVHEAAVSRADFLGARAWRISNALRGWRDVVIVAR